MPSGQTIMPGRPVNSKKKTDTWSESELSRQLKHQSGQRASRGPNEAKSTQQRSRGRDQREESHGDKRRSKPSREQHVSSTDKRTAASRPDVKGSEIKDKDRKSGYSVQPKEMTQAGTKKIRVLEEAPSVSEIEPQVMTEVREEVEEEEEPQREDEYYNEEFEEDYEEDFESGDDQGKELEEPENELPANEVEDILQAINQENRNITANQSSPDSNTIQPTAPPPPLILSPHPTLDFSTPSVPSRSKAKAKAVTKRAHEVQRIVEMDVVSIDILELVPASEYEVAMRRLGSDDSRQVACQTGDELEDNETQTDTIKTAEKWVQWPPEDLKGFGGDDCEVDNDMLTDELVSGSQRLLEFLQKAGQLCSTLLDEEEALTDTGSNKSTAPSLPFTRTSHKLSSSLLVSATCLHTTGELVLAGSAYPGSTEPWSGVVVVWKQNNLSQQHVLVCHALPRSVTSSPHNTALVFGGCEDGSLLVWDLREPHTMHRHHHQQHDGTLLRAPTYNTAGLNSHTQPIVQLCTVSTGSPNQTQEGASLSYQLAAIDSSGVLTVWVVVDLPQTDLAGSQSELGLAPGGRIKLVLSSSVSLFHLPTPLSDTVLTGSIATCLVFSPEDPNQVFVGTDLGVVLHHTRYTKRTFPHVYHASSGCASVTSISFCPFEPNVFLTSSSDGSISLFSTRNGHPLVRWPVACDTRIYSVNCLAGTAGAFVALSANYHLMIWDLLQNDADAIQTVDGSSCHKVAVSSTTITLASNDGNILLYELKSSPEREDKWSQYLNSLT